MPADYVQGYPLSPNHTKVVAANGTQINILGEMRVNLQLGGSFLGAKVLVSDAISEGMLGSDWLKAQRFNWNIPMRYLTRDGFVYPLMV